MISPQYARTMGQYNRWMNDKICAACDRLTDEQRKEDRGAFFRSIHSTLNHILWGDRIWLGRFTQDTPMARIYPKTAIGTDLYEDWEAFKSARLSMDGDIAEWAASVDEEWLARDVIWYSGIMKSMRTRPAGLLVMHLFNHQTHHRGQVTTLLSQFGIDPGDTDLMLMPI